MASRWKNKHPLYVTWCCMKQRCYNPNATEYKRYGAKGVIMCDEWKNNFKSFCHWAISNGWEKGLQIDKDIKGNGLLYSPDTCSIVTPKINSNNRSNNLLLSFQEEMYTAAELADKVSLKSATLRHRIRKGLSVEEAIQIPLYLQTNKSKKVLCIDTGAIFNMAADAERALGLPQRTVSRVCLGKRKSASGFKFKYLD